MAQFAGPRNKTDRRARGTVMGERNTRCGHLLHHFDVLGYPASRAADRPASGDPRTQPA